ncbi:hypothetical protein [Cryptosporangium sp. NPDC048952]|uniref:hypothetical protein n=1 Tax=Cryptosporangium sp. NPDC048952 TaxID=3363961 RepID=UPI0037195E34
MAIEWASTAVTGYLHTRYPHRARLIAEWTAQLSAEPADVSALPATWRPLLGTVVERLIGLDLSSTPPYADELGWLPMVVTDQVLAGAGFAGTGDDWRTWTRDPATPIQADNDWFWVCWRALEVIDLVNQMTAPSPDVQRGMWDWVSGQRTTPDEGVLAALAALWRRYLDSGRARLRALGNLRGAAPVVEDPFTADLVVGTTLVEVKVYAQPTSGDLSSWIDQLLRYVLLDRDDRWNLDRVAIYSGWHGDLVELEFSELFARLTGAKTVSFRVERDNFAIVATEYLERAYFKRHGRTRSG